MVGVFQQQKVKQKRKVILKGLLQKEEEMYRGKQRASREAKYNKKYGEIVAKERSKYLEKDFVDKRDIK